MKTKKLNKTDWMLIVPDLHTDLDHRDRGGKCTRKVNLSSIQFDRRRNGSVRNEDV